MNYGIQQLKPWEKHFPEVTEFLREDRKCRPEGIVLEFLLDFKKSIVDGLNSWGDSFQTEKKRQEKKLDDINELLNL